MVRVGTHFAGGVEGSIKGKPTTLRVFILRQPHFVVRVGTRFAGGVEGSIKVKPTILVCSFRENPTLW